MEQAIIPTHPKECGWHSDWHGCNCGLFSILKYVEPAEDGSTKYISLSCEEAILRQVEYGKKMGLTYASQEEALQEFVALNWAWLEKI